MKTKFLKIEKPCEEKWENMRSNQRGAFCNLCSKNVIDFTNLNHSEIQEILESSKGNICARITSEQSQHPFYQHEVEKKYKLPYSNIAAGFLLATAITACGNSQTTNSFVKTEVIQTDTKISNTKEETHQGQKEKESINNNTIIFRGRIFSEKGKAVEGARVTFVTKSKIISAYTSKDGRFSIEIPQDLVQKTKNVIRVTYHKVKIKRQEVFMGYDASFHMLEGEQLKSEYRILAKESNATLGMIAYAGDFDKRQPIHLINGQEVSEELFFKKIEMNNNDTNKSCSSKESEVFYFKPEYAKAIYGKKAKDGLYMLVTE
ncbi:carboxypeptidase-like regulatory domain-containing protein [Wenyingzhuangia sp. IMCC45574]